MRWQNLLAGASLASSVSAAPPLSSIKALVSSILCDADLCLRAAVLLKPGSSNAASASANCAKFMTKTVSPCPVTTTQTVSTTLTGSPITSTLTATAVSTSTNIIIISNTVINTVTALSTLTTTQFTTSIVTQTNTVSATVTSVQNSGHIQKREEQVPAGLEKRTTTAAPQCPSTTSMTTIPGTFSTCGNTSRFSSACSCFGVTAGVTTLPAVITTRTSTVTQTVTPTVSVTVTNTISTVVPSSTTTTIQLATTVTNLVTSTVTSIVSTTTTVSVTSTSTVIFAPYPTTFAILGGANSGVYAQAYSTLPGVTGYPPIIYLNSVPLSAGTLFQIRNGNQLWTADGLLQAWSYNDGVGPIEMIPPNDTADQQEYSTMQASMGGFDSTAQGYVLTFVNPKGGDFGILQVEQGDDALYFVNSFNANGQYYRNPPPLYAVAP